MTVKIVKTLWVLAALTVLAVTLYGFDGKDNSDISELLAWTMLGLSFPIGLLVSLIYAGLGSLLGFYVGVSYVSLAFDWTSFFMLGYLQWFILIPWLYKKLKKT